MRTLQWIVALAFSIVLVSVHVSFAQVIFEDNFDSQADWWPKCLECGHTASGYTNDGASSGTPVSWNYWRNDEFWNPFAPSGAISGSHPTIQISGEQHYGSSGKAFVVWNESSYGRSGDGWGADGDLSKSLGREYREIYVQLKLKFMPGFQWTWTPDQNAGSIKMVRFYHNDDNGKYPYLFFKTGTNAPVYIFNSSQKEDPYGFAGFHSFRCGPQATNYYCDQLYDARSNFSSRVFVDTMGDGKWHVLAWHATMNSKPGVSDGMLQFSADGAKL